MEIATHTIMIRFFIVFALSFIFGIERQRSHKPVGFGTFTFVAIGACGLAITGIFLSDENVNPMPLLSAIVSGIGFLGAGALIKTNDKIFGFTTAASIWLFAVFGLMIGVGEYLTAMLIYTGIWIIISVDKYLEANGMGSYQKKIIITTNKLINEKEIKQQLLLFTKKHRMLDIEVDKKNNTQKISYILEGKKEDLNRLASKLFEKEWFDSIKTE